MILNVNPNRMELLRIRKRLALAHRGHRLLSEKRDELSRQLMELARELGQLRQAVERELRLVSQRFVMARASMEPADLEVALLNPTNRLSLVMNFIRVMNISVPSLTKEVVSGGLYYGLANTSAELDASLRAMEKVIDRVLELAQKEKQAYLMATELQRTRRRVNVLERVVMPDLQDTIGHIQGKLEEVERDNINRLMRVAKKIR